VWSGDQQRYWTQRRQQWQGHGGTAATTGENWSGWDRSRRGTATTTATTDTWTRGRGNWAGTNSQPQTSTSVTTTSTGDVRPAHARRRGHND
jgi:hypothetical protein